MQAPEPSSDRRKLDILRRAFQRKPLIERASFLDAACGDDAALRVEMEALLACQGEDQRGSAPNADSGSVGVEGATTEVAPTRLDEIPMPEGPGAVIGHYKLLENLGEGGFGTVWLAEQKEPVRRQVALKIIKLGMDTREVVARFEAERQALALMDHPNIAKVFDAGTTDTGRPFFVMELVKGIPITRYCDQEKLSTTERLNLFMTVCQAIQHAHQKGIIHRDIKPSNILVTLQEGAPVPKVIDFGIAKATQQRLTDKTLHTQLQQFIGTPSYMSPEQAEMSGLDIDTRSDIYSLGVLLYELLTGKTPFDAKELMAEGLDEMRRTIREKEPIRPSTRLGTLTGNELTTTAQRRGTEAPKLMSLLRGDLDWIVMKCLEKDRTRRYATTNGLAADIKRHLDQEPVVARPPSATYLFQKLIRRNRLAFTAAAVVSVVLVLGIAASTWQAVRATRAERDQRRLREQAVLNEQKAKQAEERAQAQAFAARQKAYASDMNLAQQALAMNNLGRAQDLLDRQRPQSDQKDLRGWEWRYLWQFCQSDDLYELCRRTNGIWSLAVSADKKWLAIGEAHQGLLSVWDLKERKQFANLPAGGDRVHVAFSPTRSLLAFTCREDFAATNSRYGVRLWDGAAGQLMNTELPLGGECQSLAFSKDGQRLITCTVSPADELAIWRVKDGTNLNRYPVQQSNAQGNNFAVTPDFLLAAWVEDGQHGLIHMLDLATGKERWRAITTDNHIWTALAFSPDARLLASGAGYEPSAIHIYEVATGREIKRLAGHQGWMGALVFWPDGKTLASASSDQTIRLWDVADLANVPPPRILRGNRLEVWQLALLAGTEMLASGCKDGSVRIWDTASLRRKPGQMILATNICNWRFTADGTSILTIDWQGHLAQWSGGDFRQMQSLMDFSSGTLVNLDGEWRNHSFTGDGRMLATVLTNGTVQVWDLRQRTLLREFSGLGTPWTCGFLAQGHKLLTVNLDDGSHHELDVATGQVARSWGAGQIPWPYYTTVSLDERWCLTVGVRSLLKDMTTDKETTLGVSESEVGGVAFSPDGGLFAIPSGLGFADVWETAPLRRVVRLAGFLQGVHSVAWSPDCKRLATGSDGREAIKLWDVASHEDLLTLDAEGSVFSRSDFSPDGNILGSVNRDGALYLWRAPSWDEIAAAEKTTEGKTR